MIKKTLLLLLILATAPLSGQIYTSVSAEISSRYLHHRLLPAGKNPVLALNGNAYLSNSNLNISSWFVQSLGNFSDFREFGFSVYYYHEFNTNLYLSAGLNGYLFPYAKTERIASMSFALHFSDMRSRIPYIIETHIDPFIGSWYTKFSVAYTLDTFLPFQFQLSTAFDLLPYTRFGIRVPAGISDLSLQVGTYLSLKNWHFQPKLSYIIPWNVPSGPKMLLSAGLNIGYTFWKE